MQLQVAEKVGSEKAKTVHKCADRQEAVGVGESKQRLFCREVQTGKVGDRKKQS
jgi:hypothetical protein